MTAMNGMNEYHDEILDALGVIALAVFVLAVGCLGLLIVSLT